MKETDIQAQIKKSVRLDGGYCHKLTNAFTVGIPDLLIALPPFAPCVIEIKSLNYCGGQFDRKIEVTPKQRHELFQISEVYNNVDRPLDQLRPTFSGIFVHTYVNKTHYLTGLPYRAERHTAVLLADAARTRKRGSGEYWDIRPLLEAIGITKV